MDKTKKISELLGKRLSCTNSKAEILIDQAVQTNIIRSVLFNAKTSYRIEKSDIVGEATILVPETQEDPRRG